MVGWSESLNRGVRPSSRRGCPLGYSLPFFWIETDRLAVDDRGRLWQRVGRWRKSKPRHWNLIGPLATVTLPEPGLEAERVGLLDSWTDSHRPEADVRALDLAEYTAGIGTPDGR